VSAVPGSVKVKRYAYSSPSVASVPGVDVTDGSTLVTVTLTSSWSSPPSSSATSTVTTKLPLSAYV
jgi:hypothetical protein